MERKHVLVWDSGQFESRSDAEHTPLRCSKAGDRRFVAEPIARYYGVACQGL